MCDKHNNTHKTTDRNHTYTWFEVHSCRPKSQWWFYSIHRLKNGDPYIVEVKATGRKIHNYLGMTLKYYDKWTLKIGMRDYVKQMINYLPIKLDKNDTVTTPASEELLKISNRNILSKEKADTFHTITTKCMFLCKREMPDIQPIISILSIRVNNPNEVDAK